MDHTWSGEGLTHGNTDRPATQEWVLVMGQACGTF